MGDSGQTYQQFMEMKGITPNQQGTGRISFSDVKTIQFLYIRNKKNEKKSSQLLKKQFRNIGDLLYSYLHIPTQIRDYQLQYEQGIIIDPERNLQYTVKRNKKRVDALQMLDLLIEYKNQSNLLIGFIEEDLHENGGDVYGRACGNGVGIVDFNMPRNMKQQLYKFYGTVIHQTLHTLGFDHCLAYCCLMNPCVAGEMWLCPCCLKKLFSEFEGKQISLLSWSQMLKLFYQKHLPWQKALLNKTDRIIQLLSQPKQSKSKSKGKSAKTK